MTSEALVSDSRGPCWRAHSVHHVMAYGFTRPLEGIGNMEV